MAIENEMPTGRPNLTVSREPVGSNKSSMATKSIGDQALMDAVVIVAIAWLILFSFSFSLRHHNI